MFTFQTIVWNPSYREDQQWMDLMTLPFAMNYLVLFIWVHPACAYSMESQLNVTFASLLQSIYQTKHRYSLQMPSYRCWHQLFDQAFQQRVYLPQCIVAIMSFLFYREIVPRKFQTPRFLLLPSIALSGLFGQLSFFFVFTEVRFETLLLKGLFLKAKRCWFFSLFEQIELFDLPGFLVSHWGNHPYNHLEYNRSRKDLHSLQS